MLKRQKNKLAMYGATLTYIDNHSAVYLDNEEFILHKTSLSQTLEALGLKEDERNKATKGKLKDKNVTREAVTKQALAIAGALYAFAKKAGNQPLIASANFTKSKFDKLRDVELKIELNSLKDKAGENSAAIIKYGISANKLESYVSNIEIYSKAIGAKDTGGAVKKGAFKSLSTLFKETDNLLDSIDRLMENYIDSNEQFYAGYKAARVIKDMGIRHNPEEPEVPDQPPPENMNKAVQ